MTALATALALLLAHPPALDVPQPLAHRAVFAVAVALLARDRAEVRRVARVVRGERTDAGERSRTGCAGVAQLQPRVWHLDARRLDREPVYSAASTLAVARAIRRECGDALFWRCWRYTRRTALAGGAVMSGKRIACCIAAAGPVLRLYFSGLPREDGEARLWVQQQGHVASVFRQLNRTSQVSICVTKWLLNGEEYVEVPWVYGPGEDC